MEEKEEILPKTTLPFCTWVMKMKEKMSSIDAEVEVKDLVKMVVEARRKTQQVEHDIEQARKTQRAIKEANDERIRKIQEENRELDSQLATKEITLNKAKSEIETQIHEAKAKLLRRIVICNLKNLLKNVPTDDAPEDALSTIYTGRFAIVYDEITVGNKPVNCNEWKVRIKIPETKGHTLNSLLEHAWVTYRELHRNYAETSFQFYQRDFKSEEDAKAYAERNKAKICQKLIEGIEQFERETEEANGNIDEVFDFRLITDSVINAPYSHSQNFRVVSAKKHQLKLAPLLSNYERAVEKIQPYTITIMQQGYQLTIAGHRFSGQAREIKYAICRYFNTEFKAIEADTHQEIQNPTW